MTAGGDPSDRTEADPGTATGRRSRRERTDASDVARLRDPLGHEAVPRGVQVTAAWCWRLLVIAGALAVGIYVIGALQLVIVPLMVALLINALIQPVAAWLHRRGVPETLAALITLIGALGVIALLVWLVVHEFRQGYGDLRSKVDGGIDKVRDWLVSGPLHLSQQQIDDYITSAKKSVRDNRETLTAGALSTATTVGHVVTGAALSLFATFFFLKDGPRIWAWIVRLFPRGTQHHASEGGAKAWRTLIAYVRATITVAAVDAVGIGIALAILRVPLALPLAVLVFLGAFIPVIGATLSGLVAVLVALVANGPVTALFVLAAVILVQQIEGHILQPLLLGRAVSVHPLAVVFSIAAGVLLAGIVGALVAVPLVAVANTVAGHLSGADTEPDGGPPAGAGDPPPAAAGVSAPAES
jgi:predicted PurR-regulated permease PerM